MKQIDFTPQWHMARLRRKAFKHRRRTLTVVLLMMFGGWYLVGEARINMAHAELAELEAAYIAQVPMVTTAEYLQTQLKQQQYVANVRDALAGGVKIHQVMAELSQQLPDGVAISNLRVERQDRVYLLPADKSAKGQTGGAPRSGRRSAAGEQAEAGKRNMRLVGFARTQSLVGRFINQLERSPLFQDVNLVYSRSLDKEGLTLREFELEYTLREFK